jgi:hypothetical protein
MTMMLNVFYSFVLAHLIVKFEPIHWFIDAVDPYLRNNKKNMLTSILWNIFTLAIGCFKCCSLYVGWIVGGFWCGVMTSFFAYIYSQSIAPFIDGIRFK